MSIETPKSTRPTAAQLIEAIERFNAAPDSGTNYATLSLLLQAAECGEGPLVAYGGHVYRIGLCGSVEVFALWQLEADRC